MTIAVITANLGGFDPIHEYVKQSVDYDFYRFTDENFLPRVCAMTSRMQARLLKCFAWQIVPGYDIYIWVDGSCSLLHEDSVKWFIEHLGDRDAAFFKHPDRNTIQEEADFLKKCLERKSPYILKRYKGEWIDEQMAEIHNDPFYMDDLLIASTAFIYKDNVFVECMLKEWWYHISRYHIIDQLSLPYVLKNNAIHYNIINEKYGEIPYLTYTRKMKHG